MSLRDTVAGDSERLDAHSTAASKFPLPSIPSRKWRGGDGGEGEF